MDEDYFVPGQMSIYDYEEEWRKADKNLIKKEISKMMNYEEFKEVLLKEFKEFLPEELKEAEIKVTICHKTNKTREGLALVFPEKKKNVAPILYIDEMYKEYKISNDLMLVFRNRAKLIGDVMEKCEEIASEFESIEKEKICFRLVNTEMNKELLEKVPHREFEDLSVIYYIFRKNETETYSMNINNELADYLELTEEKLFELAFENTASLLEPTVDNLQSLLKTLMDEVDVEEIDELQNVQTEMVVICNKEKRYGATALLYPNVIDAVANGIFESDIYILPSSIHEIIAISAEGMNLKGIKQMVAEINLETVSTEEILSNSVYFYDRNTSKLSRC